MVLHSNPAAETQSTFEDFFSCLLAHCILATGAVVGGDLYVDCQYLAQRHPSLKHHRGGMP